MNEMQVWDVKQKKLFWKLFGILATLGKLNFLKKHFTVTGYVNRMKNTTSENHFFYVNADDSCWHVVIMTTNVLYSNVIKSSFCEIFNFNDVILSLIYKIFIENLCVMHLVLCAVLRITMNKRNTGLVSKYWDVYMTGYYYITHDLKNNGNYN